MRNQAQVPYVKAMLKTIKEGGGTEIRVNFDGAGDSGSIESVYIYKGTEVLNMMFNVDYLVRSSEYNKEQGGWVQKTEVKSMPVNDAIEQFCYDMLEETGVDWYNNDGGYGEFTINLDPVEVNLEISTRYTEVHTDTFDFAEDLIEEEE